MKKLVAIVCAAALVFSVTGCGQTKEASVEQLLSEKLVGEITVSCYDTMFYKDFLEKAAKAFEKKNPDTKIKVETFAAMPEVKTSESDGTMISVISAGDDTQERANYISKINTELMSGEGADVLAMDILPYYKYADGGQLEDLQAYMDADSGFDSSDYCKNVLEAMKYHGGQYIVPLDYRFDYMAYDTSLFTEEEHKNLQETDITYEKLIKAAQEAFARANTDSDDSIRMFGITAGSQMFRELLNTDYAKYIDIENNKVNLTDGNFAKMLESVKKYGENGYLEPNSDSEEFTIEDFEMSLQSKFFYKSKDSYSLLGEALKSAGSESFYSFGTDLGNENNDKTLGLLTNADGEVEVDYFQAYGINSNSDNKALAWAFLKFLLSEEIQASQELTPIGLPVNKAAHLEKAQKDISGMVGMYAEDTATQSKELTEAQQKAYDYYLKSTEEFSALLNHHSIQDDTINEMIDKEAKRYFDGSKSADEVASALQEKIELYLNE